MAALELSWVKMETISANFKIAQALNAKLSQAIKLEFKLGEDITVYKEKEGR